MEFWHRTHTCGQLRETDEGLEVVLNGWVHNWRHHGGVIFIDLRDRYGITQLVFDPGIDQEVWRRAEQLRHEYVVAVKGVVRKRPENMANPGMATGRIEVAAAELQILNQSETPPVQIHNPEWEEAEETRLRYRFLDLRRPAMQGNVLFRHKLVAEVRKHLWEKDFVEIETPILMKSTPEGARDFLVPSRLNKGKFYALPQSPQTYKQILMVAGYDRYFQIARCFRDEDLRADRQPEFTQVDAEMSFVNEEDIYAVFEGMMKHVFAACLGKEVSTPFTRMSYEEALRRYGSDKPDLRFGMPIHTVTDLFGTTEFKILRSVIDDKGTVGALGASGGAKLSRKDIDALTKHVAVTGAKGLIWMRVTENGVESPTAKFLSQEEIEGLVAQTKARPGDMIFMIAAPRRVCYTSLGRLRLELGRRLELIDRDSFAFTWIEKFPLFEYSEEQDSYVPTHHPFTSPVPEDLGLLETDEYYRARARAYDMVLNGSELGGGSIRIHSTEVQKKVFSLLGIGPEEAEAKFGFLLRALRYGAPPHGGIAFGLDRMAMVMRGLETIRDVIPFPKTTAGLSLMANAPDTVSEAQLRELGLRMAK